MVVTEESSSSTDFTPSHPEIPAHRMESTAGTERVQSEVFVWEPETSR